MGLVSRALDMTTCRLKPARREAMGLVCRVLDMAAPPVLQVDRWQPDSPEVYCHHCGASLGPGAACAYCAGQHLPWKSLTRLSAYKPPMEHWITGMKFRREWQWCTWLGERLAEAAPAIEAGQKVLICPAPMHWMRRWRRGYNQADMMALAFARRRGLPCVSLLRRTRYTRPQTLVQPHQRERNVRGSVRAIVPDLSGMEIWLVDDVKTSGSTLRQCTNALSDAGAEVVHIFVGAVGHPLDHDFTKV